MEWQVIVALLVGIPVVLFPVMFVLYLNVGGLLIVLKGEREKRRVNKKSTEVFSKIENQ